MNTCGQDRDVEILIYRDKKGVLPSGEVDVA